MSRQFNMRLTNEDDERLERVSASLGLSHPDTVRELLRRADGREGSGVAPKAPTSPQAPRGATAVIERTRGASKHQAPPLGLQPDGPRYVEPRGDSYPAWMRPKR